MDLDAILTPIAGDNPSGDNLRYEGEYDAIQEARRADDVLDQGDWQHEVKVADWNEAYSLAVDALTNKTKDLQISAWLLEALTHTRGFEGIAQGLEVINGLLEQFWETLYPEIDEGDLDYRVGPLEFVNDKIWFPIKEIPITDPGRTQGYSWNKWQESRNVGYESQTVNEYGDVIDDKKNARDEKIADGKLTAEDFDAAVNSCPRAYYESLEEQINRCIEAFTRLDEMVDEKFGREAPRLAEFRTSLEDCHQLALKIVKQKRIEEPDPEPEPEPEPQYADEPFEQDDGAVYDEGNDAAGGDSASVQVPPQAPAPSMPSVQAVQGQVGGYRVNRILGGAGIEEAVWQDTLDKLSKDGIKPALEQLLGASCSAQSVREKTNFQLLMARLCLRANRADLARPIIEELNTLIETLQLDQWESPIWIAEALGTLYQCLTAEGSSDDDYYRAQDILTRLCTLDITKAMEFSDTAEE